MVSIPSRALRSRICSVRWRDNPHEDSFHPCQSSTAPRPITNRAVVQCPPSAIRASGDFSYPAFVRKPIFHAVNRAARPSFRYSGKYTTGVRPVSKFSMGAILGNHGNAAVVVIGNDVIRLNSLLAATGNEGLPGGFGLSEMLDHWDVWLPRLKSVVDAFENNVSIRNACEIGAVSGVTWLPP